MGGIFYTMKIELLESEVEDIIFEGQLLEDYDIKCIKRQVKFGSAGIVDILGWDRYNKRWVIIEIKRDGLDARAYAQGMRYRSWLSKYMNYRSCERQKSYNEPYILLIGAGANEDLRFLKAIGDDEDRDSNDSYYTIFNINPMLELGNFNMRAANTYQDCITYDMEGDWS
jgi:hypothetical protein